MKLRHIILSTFCLCGFLTVGAQQCNIHLMVAPSPQTEDVPDAIMESMLDRLRMAATADGVVAYTNNGQFFITGRFSHLMHEVLPGPPRQTAVHTLLTLYIGDARGQKVFATKQFELRGVGGSDQRALINAMQSLNYRNRDFESFISSGRDKIIDYYQSHLSQILSEAKSAAALHDYGTALSLTAAVPECVSGYESVRSQMLVYYQQYIDLTGTQALDAAKAAWAADPSAAGAVVAMQYLAGIDPSSSAYSGAQALVKEMGKTVKSDRDFELRDKYHDKVALEKSRIEAARAVGVAFGNGQKPTTTNLMWLK